MKNLKNTVSNIVGIVIGIATVVQSALGHIASGSKWFVWVGGAAVAIISYLTGKGPDGKKQPTTQ
jgi:hypothetical protein